MTERQMIQEILNTVDVTYDFENTNDDTKEYDIAIVRQKEDKRPVDEINGEIKKYFQEADFSYDEKISPDENTDILVSVKK
ncbi:hypothetical protein [Lentilactobacillus sp. Marseille-Q4993]|uniref:hypothetical protein n=1 Tax=Lentilactobacillus sp. Marseille-Q4993 TaxID=3039492 RepID=UPI0024BBF0B3|nr:hypothetical protein [Lentilactobacillus sp. Marseille-Q4993]